MGVLQFLDYETDRLFCVRQDHSLEYGKRNSRSGMFRIVPKFKKEKVPKKSSPQTGKSVCVCVCVCMRVRACVRVHPHLLEYSHMRRTLKWIPLSFLHS